MRQRNGRFAIVCGSLGAMAMALTACGTGAAVQPTLDEQQAVGRLEQHVQDAAGAIQPPPRLEIQSAVLAQECDNPSDGGPEGRVTVSVAYWLRDVPSAGHDEVFTQLKRHWNNPQWRVLDDVTDRQEAPSYWVENTNDYFRVRVLAGLDRQLSLTVASPCIWPEGAPGPESG